jgi:hypothetical protein
VWGEVSRSRYGNWGGRKGKREHGHLFRFLVGTPRLHVSWP